MGRAAEKTFPERGERYSQNGTQGPERSEEEYSRGDLRPKEDGGENSGGEGEIKGKAVVSVSSRDQISAEG